MYNVLLAILSAMVARLDFAGLAFLIASNLRVPWIKRIRPTYAQLLILASKLKHGDLLFGRRDWFLKNLLVPGRYKHVCVWDAERQLVLEFQDSGYEENTLGRFVTRYTEVAAFGTGFTPEYASKFIEMMRSFHSKLYDKKYSKNTEALYCSESVHAADVDKILQYEASEIFWFEVFIPDELTKLPAVKKIFQVNKSNLTQVIHLP